ncbi:hypothetical protein EN866_34295 [Mesorhizobium sp. M2D.F.Ca.ET.223.01.1.1]|uniref:hypothetical protein n=1 Tax=Mesorhizobium sp. M2D.F.Ca.ET.223.01.1.1 TaxID=2563940 RepID=UPI001091C4B4|nr:hypothetical protein [Mesorhizobium sp. M2D.F.Ca.ET.223.01.1.1]TGR83321.1 hypothetical protein EN866_34295 [Mesorhizobium sp. M2D.F.Ca.ET.223.01.1.1]TGT63342.1 hypothetical protein EN802_33165 [bacterium M00.F.Ca.ET.159.01.1.1]TGT79150.1 hypothetical protein EN800_32510 [bacterium M00.F.Ca.ET.157.01.1.1]
MTRFTADDARRGNIDDLDRRIKAAVRDGGANHAWLRIYHDDAFRFSIGRELEARGFINIRVPDITIKGDVYFEWE